jgi:type III secretion system FlhB-like substrate exporter
VAPSSTDASRQVVELDTVPLEVEQEFREELEREASLYEVQLESQLLRELEMRLAGGPGSGWFREGGHVGKGGAAEGKRAEVSVDEVKKIYKLTDEGHGDAAIAKRMGWYYSEGKRVRAVRDMYDRDGVRKELAPKPEPPKPEPPKVTPPVAEPVVPKAELTEHEVKVKEIYEMVETLKTLKVRVDLPLSVYDVSAPTNPVTEARRESEVAVVHTALGAMIESRRALDNLGVLDGTTPVTLNFGTNASNVYAHADGKAITVNTQFAGWQNPARLQQATQGDADSGYHPTGHPSSVLTHEFGHTLHNRASSMGTSGVASGMRTANFPWGIRSWTHQEVRTMRVDTPRGSRHALLVAAEVSRYAKKNPVEFVAETFAGMVHGKKYPPHVHELYNFLQGPKVRGHG